MALPVAILAGGLATRLGDLTRHLPKSLVDVGGRPFAEHQVRLLQRHGITDIVFLVGHLGNKVREALGDGSRFGVRLRYVFDGADPLGTGGALRRAVQELGDRFFVLYGDSYLECDYGAVERTFADAGTEGLMTVCRNEGRWDCSNVLFVQGRIERYDKEARDAGMRHIDYGLGAFRRTALERWPEDTRFDLSVVYRELLGRGQLAAFEVEGRFYEIGSHRGLEETRAHLAAGAGHAETSKL